MERLRKFVDGVRMTLRRAYADETFVGLLPTRQILAATGAAALTALVQNLLSFNLPDGYAEAAVALAVGYLIGPPVKPEDVSAAKALGVIEGLRCAEEIDRPLESRGGGDTSLPRVPGKFVGPERDPDEPGQVL